MTWQTGTTLLTEFILPVKLEEYSIYQALFYYRDLLYATSNQNKIASTRLSGQAYGANSSDLS